MDEATLGPAEQVGEHGHLEGGESTNVKEPEPPFHWTKVWALGEYRAR